MAAKDFYHQQVREILIAEGWIITHDPYFLKMLFSEKLLQSII